MVSILWEGLWAHEDVSKVNKEVWAAPPRAWMVMDLLLLWLRLSFEREVIRSNQLSHHGQLWSRRWAVSAAFGTVWSQANRTANGDVTVWADEEGAPGCHMSEKVAAWQPETHSETRPGGIFTWPGEGSNFRDRHGWVDTQRNFPSCGFIRKTTESFTGLLQQLKFNNRAADKIVEPLVEKPNADVRRFTATHGENDRSGRVQRGCSAGQMAKKVFLIKWQRGLSFNKSAKSFHSLNLPFTEHTQLWQETEELRADWRWEIHVLKDHLDQINPMSLSTSIKR